MGREIAIPTVPLNNRSPTYEYTGDAIAVFAHDAIAAQQLVSCDVQGAFFFEECRV